MNTRIALNVIEKLPFIGGLVHCSIAHHKEAFKKWGTNVGASLAPILVTIFISLIADKNTATTTNTIDIIYKCVSNGELFIYCASLVAPVLYLSQYDREGIAKYPSRLGHVIIFILIILGSTIFFTLRRLGVNINIVNAYNISLGFFITSIILLYLAILFDNYRVDPEVLMRRDEHDFVAGYEKHRR